MLASEFQPALNAKHDLHREEMTRFGDQLPWLADPSIVPATILDSCNPANLPMRTTILADWMINQFGTMSATNQGKLDWQGKFDKYGVSNDERIFVRSLLRDDPGQAYQPGIYAMSEIFSAVPLLIHRAGGARSEWSDLAATAQSFGSRLSVKGTGVQSFIRQYLWIEDDAQSPVRMLDPAKLQLDEATGITTATPVGDLIDFTSQLMATLGIGQTVCAALKAKSPAPHQPNMFAAVWKAYGALADRLIYPYVELPPTIPVRQDPDPNYKHAILRIYQNSSFGYFDFPEE